MKKFAITAITAMCATGALLASFPFPAITKTQVTQVAATAPDHVANANARLSLTGISVGKHVIQDDNSTEYVYNGGAEAVQIIGAGTEAANGYYTKRGTFNGRPYYNLIGTPNATAAYAVSWSGSDWKIFKDDGNNQYGSTDDVAYPWLVTTWSQNGGDTPVPTTAHIASKNALTTCAFVSGAGTTAANGIYTERPALGEPVAGRKVYNLLGQPDDLANYAIFPGTITKWTITDSGGSILYTSTDNVNSPWLVTTWVAVAVPREALPVVVSKTQGELDAGVLVTGAGTPNADDVYLLTGNRAGRSSYSGIAFLGVLQHDPTWQVSGTDPQSPDDTAFPWEASFNDSATVAENPIASESNWEPL